LSSAKHRSTSRGRQLLGQIGERVRGVTSTLVIGSAETTTRRTGVGDSATAPSTRSLNSSALAKNSGASQRNSTSPDPPRSG
jgi:hypothetical protein